MKVSIAYGDGEEARAKEVLDFVISRNHIEWLNNKDRPKDGYWHIYLHTKRPSGKSGLTSD